MYKYSLTKHIYCLLYTSSAEDAMKNFYYEMYRSGVMDEETYELLTR